MSAMKKAIQAIDKYGILLVYPIKNAGDPPSLWSVLHPRSKMEWEWSDDSNNDRVADLWHLRMELSTSKKAVYTKWYQNRATFFSREYFTAALAILRQTKIPLSRDALNLLALMQESSPLSTKELKMGADLRGKLLESTYNKAMKELWSRLFIVGFGEVDDGAFPSLAVGATSLLFEDLWEEAKATPSDIAYNVLLGMESEKFRAFLLKEKSKLGLEPRLRPRL
jgi:hypothetical protein